MNSRICIFYKILGTIVTRIPPLIPPYYGGIQGGFILLLSFIHINNNKFVNYSG